MLILSRYRDEIIDVTVPAERTASGKEETISIMVTDVNRDRVSIGIEAPKDFLILRRELKDRKPREKKDGQSKPYAA